MIVPRVLLFVLFAVMLAGGAVVTCEARRLKEVAEQIAPPAPRRFETLGLVTVGTGGTYENPARLGPVVAVGHGERLVLVDAGRATTEALRKAKIPVDQPDTVFLTSLLPENVLGLGELLVSGWLVPRAKPLRLVGPPGTRALAEAVERAARPGIEALATKLGIDPSNARFDVVETDGRFEETSDAFAVRAGALGGGPLPALAWRFEAGRRSIVVCGAGWDRSAAEALAADADVLAIGAYNPPSIEAGLAAGGPEAERLRGEASLHLSLEDVGALAERARVRSVVLVRLLPPPVRGYQYTRVVRKAYSGSVVVADDGDELTR